MTKVVYLYDSSNTFTGSKLVDDNYVIQASETEVKPVDGLYTPITWNGTAWVGTDEKTWQAQQEAERQANQKANPVTPSSEQQMINALGLQFASLQATVTKLTTTNGGAA